MGKLVVIKIGEGSFDQGFPVTLYIGEEGTPFPASLDGKLPPEPQLPVLYDQWKLEYDEFLCGRQTKLPSLKEKKEGKIQKSSPQDFIDGVNTSASKLITTLNNWLKSETFRPIKDKLQQRLDLNDIVRVIIQTEDLILPRLPWGQWNWLDDYTKAEVAISFPNYEKPSQLAKPKPKVRVLAIIGDPKTNTQNYIDLNPDKQFWENLSNEADTEFLEEPTRQKFNEKLWDEQGWDIFFFAGHSSSNLAASRDTALPCPYGEMVINSGQSLAIPDLKYALKEAIKGGLQLAIFNSCDGLGLAKNLAELNIPQIIVMREPIPDKVAQKFLEYFLQAFSRGEPLYIALREAREKLHALENEYPCASWLPVICQNPTVKPVTWQGFKQAITSSFLADMFQTTYPSVSNFDLAWFCSLVKNKNLDETIKKAYQDSLTPVLKSDLKLWGLLENNNIKQILQILERFERLPQFLNHLIQQDESLPEEIRSKLTELNPERMLIMSRDKSRESYLIVTVKPDDKPKEFVLKSWLIMDDSVPLDNNPYRFWPLIDDQNQTEPEIKCNLDKIPEYLDKLISKSEDYLEGKKRNLTIEVFLPIDLICQEVDRWKITDPSVKEIPLGVIYPIRLRSLERQDRLYLRRYESKWRKNWDKVRSVLDQKPTPELFEHLQEMKTFSNWEQVSDSLDEKIGLKLTCAPPHTKTRELFMGILQATTPIALWTRCDLSEPQVAEIDQILMSQPLKNLCESVKRTREKANAQKNDQHLGFHLSLLWDNPYRIPPDVMLDLISPGQ